jgi:transposase
MKEPELVTATQEELDEILRRARPALSDPQYRLLEGVLATFVYVMLKLQNAKTSIKRFQRMLFGHRTEHKRNVLERAAQPGDSDALDAESVPELPGVASVPVPVPRPPQRGHGRNAAQAYSGAPIVQCDHPELTSGDRCPQCDKGRVYDSPPRSIVKVVGQAPLGATVYKVQRLRCRLCDTVFSAPLPAAVAALPKYDSSCASMIAMLRYGNGMPHFRLEGLQASLYVPLPDATQWDIVSKAVPAPRAVFQELIVQAAQAPLLHSDDTPMKVLSLMAERARAEADGVKPRALAINTSGIVAVLEQHKVVLFFTGHAHAGKNMERVLAHRAQELAPAMQMCDALAANLAGEFKTVLSNCLTHYPEHGFIPTPVRLLAPTTSGGRALLTPHKFGTFSAAWHPIFRRGRIGLHGLSCLYSAALHASAFREGHPAGVARRPQPQRAQCPELPALDRPVSLLLP